MTGTRLKLSVRVDQPVESVSTRTTAYIRGLGPVEKDAAIWSWQRSSLSVACMNAACPFNHSKATMECVCFETTFRYCSAQCLKMSWKEINSTKSKDISTIQKRKETKNKGKDNEEALLESDMDVEGKKHIVKLRDWLQVVLPRLVLPRLCLPRLKLFDNKDGCCFYLFFFFFSFFSFFFSFFN